MLKSLIKKIYKILPFKPIIFKILRNFWHPSENTFKHLHFVGEFQLKYKDFRPINLFHYGKQLENQLFWGGIDAFEECISLKIWMELCKEANVILDVGANTGIYAVTAYAANPKATIHSFEPMAKIMAMLKHNVSLNDNKIICHQYGLSNFDGEAIVYEPIADHYTSVTVNKDLSQGSNIETQITKILVKRFDTFCQETQLNTIDLIKIDVETHEPEVLQGMGELLRKYQPTMIIEILTQEVATQVQQIVAGLDYLFFNIDERNPPNRVTVLKPSGHFNYLFCNEAVAKKLGLSLTITDK